MLNLSGCYSKLKIAGVLVSLALAYPGLSYAEVESQIKAVKLNEVTVFLRGAELFNSAEINLPEGESEVIFTNIATDINEKTLLIATDSKTLIKSSQIRRDYLNDPQKSPEIAKLTQQVEELQEQRQQLAIDLEVIDAQLTMLQEKTQSGGDKTVSVEDIRGMWAFIDTQMKESLKAKAQLTKTVNELDKKLASLHNQIREQQAKGLSSSSQLVVKFFAEKPITTKVNFSYAIQSANWVPTYDVTVDKVNGPVQFTYKASVAQASGISWDNVHLKLSTGNLSQSAQAPILEPNYLSLFQPEIYRAGSYSDAAFESAAPQSVAMKEMVVGEDIKKARSVSNTPAPVSINDYVVTNVNGINTTFDISLPYSIPSDAKQHLVAIKEQQTKGDYRYFVIPKLSDNAFLQVQIADWQALNLLPGKSNVFFEGSFIGEGYINVNDIRDEMMNISLGRDSKIMVNRKSIYELTSKPKFFGSNITQDYAYNIDINNSRSDAIKLVVLDQIPVSRDSTITVSDAKYDNKGQLNKDSGELQWTLDMDAKATKKLQFSYVVKYPEDKQVAGL